MKARPLVDSDGALILRRHPSEVERARRHVANACSGFDDDFVLTATLLTSELVSNALEHGDGDITVLVAPISAGVRVDVADGNLVEPQRQAPAPDDVSGRGLLIVDTLATAWGVDVLPQGGGKSVWFALLAG